MISGRGRAAALGLATLAWVSASAGAQVFTLDNEEEVKGAAIAAPLFNRLLVEKTGRYCVDAFRDLAAQADAAAAGWNRRNADDVETGIYLHDRLKASMTGRGPKFDAAWKDFEQQMDDQTRVGSDTLIKQFEAIGSVDTRKQMCANFFSSVNAGRLDVAKGDPKVVDYLKTHRKP